MDFALLVRFIDVTFRELWQRKFLCLFGFAVVSFSVLVVGIFWPSKFETSATIFADNQNILKPLLESQAAQSKVQNHTKVVTDTIQSPRILKTVVDNLYGSNNFESAEELGQAINKLRSKVSIRGLGAGYIKISYSDSTAEESYRVINEVVDVFIRASTDEQRAESREAFLFIDNQVKQYKDQLLLAEERLKDFRSQNFDGRDGDVDSSISRIRSQIEELKIRIDEDKTAVKTIRSQLSNESEFSSQKYKADVYGERLKSLEDARNNLLLTYTDDYPDVVSLTYQIEDIRKAMREAETVKSVARESAGDDQEAILNPLYQELRSRLSVSQTEMQTKEKRLGALRSLMDKEFERRKRIAERGAEEAELTRDYTVTKRIYEDMLERKEKARLSMTLNVQGQGVTYRVQEPALPPLNPIGLRFLHFVLLGPVIGLMFIIGLAISYIIVDQRIRFPEKLQDMGVTTLAVVPHIKTSFSKRVVRIDMIICVVLSILIMGAYIGLAFAAKLGMI